MPIDKRRAALIATTAALLAGPAMAADASADRIQVAALLDEVTVTATRSAKPVDAVPATVSVITARQIEDQLATDIKDLVRFEPGVSVRNSPSRFTAAGASTGRDGNSGFNIRGLEGNRVLTLIDGVRLPDAYSFGAQAMGRGDYVDVGVLKSVEILRGPASALYGSDGVVGAVSFLTKDPQDFLRGGKAWAAEGRASYASADDSWAKTATLAGATDGWSGFISYTRRDGREQETAGDSDAPNLTRTRANPQDAASNAILGKLVYDFDAHNRTRLTVDHIDHQLDTDVLSALAVPPLSSTSAIGLLAEDSSRRDRVSLDHAYSSDAGPIRAAHATVYWQRSKTNQFSAEDRYTAADRTRIGTFNTRTWGAALELNSQLETGPVSHRLVYGGDYSRTRQDGVRDGTVPPVGETFPTLPFPTTDYTLAGVYLQDEISLFGGRLTAYPALRYDHYKLDPQAGEPLYTGAAPAAQSKSHVSPKLGVVFDVAPRVRLFANYGAGFKAPSPNQVNNGFANLVANYRSISNPDLKPETSVTFEGGVRLHGETWRASATAFTGKYKNFISQEQVSGAFTPASPAIYQFVNLSQVKISGVEARGEVALGRGFTFNIAAAYAKGDQTTDGVKTPLDSIDPVKVVAGLAWAQADDRYGGQLIVTRSEGKSLDRAGGACGTSCFTPPGFTLLDATAFWRVTDKATLRAGVFNITDKKYWWWSDVRGLTTSTVALDAYTQPGRNFGISLDVRL